MSVRFQLNANLIANSKIAKMLNMTMASKQNEFGDEWLSCLSMRQKYLEICWHIGVWQIKY